jgi:hypothetical protein
MNSAKIWNRNVKGMTRLNREVLMENRSIKTVSEMFL